MRIGQADQFLDGLFAREFDALAQILRAVKFEALQQLVAQVAVSADVGIFDRVLELASEAAAIMDGNKCFEVYTIRNWSVWCSTTCPTSVTRSITLIARS